MAKKRVTLSKAVRFEVFKRDKFTCQYCGAKSPDVILHVDHLTPVAKGGDNSILNLVTACVACNSGKSATPLDDDTAVKKASKQAEALAARREQIEMMRDWHLSLIEQSDAEVEAVDSLFIALTNGEFRISESYKPTVKKIIRQFGLDLALEALRTGSEGYKDPSKALNKLGGICACLKDPSIGRRGMLKAAARRKFWNFKDWQFADLINEGYRYGGDAFLDDVERLTGAVRGTWAQVRHAFEGLVSEWAEDDRG